MPIDKKIERKVRKVGNSTTITIPVEIVEEQGLHEGDVVVFESRGNQFIVHKKEEVVSEDFMQTVKRISEEQKAVIEGLVDR